MAKFAFVGDGKEKERSDESAIDFTPKYDTKGNCLNPEVLSKTVQSLKDECDFNRIVEIALKNGGLVVPPLLKEQFADVSNVGDWMTIKNKVAMANSAFSQLPEGIRKKFNHNVSNLIAYLQDPANDKEAASLGLKDVLPEPEQAKEATPAPGTATPAK